MILSSFLEPLEKESSSIMQLLTPLVTLCFLIGIGYSASGFDITPFNENAFDFSSDSSLSLNLLNNPSIQETNPLDQSIDSNIDWFLDTGHPLSQTSEPDSTFFLADDINCDVNNADDNQLFDKRRRGAACKTPKATTEDENLINPTDPFNTNQLLEKNPSISDFKSDFEACPKAIFESSNIPVCQDEITL